MLYFQILQWLQARQNVEDASTRLTLSATCVGTSQQLHSVEPSLPSSKPPNFYYFDCKVGDQDKSWAAHICCKPCYNGLTAWFNSKKAAFNFAVTMVWREPWNNADDCYFCLTNITRFNASYRKKIKYPNLRSAMRPVPHSDYLPVATPPVNKDLLSSSDEGMPSREDSVEKNLWKILSLHIQEQVAMSLIVSHKKTWMILLVICICQNSSQSSWLLGLNSGTQSRKM